MCPGLVYFLFKHFVDKHNLAFVYARSKINKNVHRLNDAFKWGNSFTVLPRLTQCVQYCSLVTRSGINSNSFQHCIFRSAINFVMFSVGLLQVFMLSFSFIRLSFNPEISQPFDIFWKIRVICRSLTPHEGLTMVCH